MKQKSDMIRTESFRKTGLSTFFSRVEYKKIKDGRIKGSSKSRIKMTTGLRKKASECRTSRSVKI